MPVLFQVLRTTHVLAWIAGRQDQQPRIPLLPPRVLCQAFPRQRQRELFIRKEMQNDACP